MRTDSSVQVLSTVGLIGTFGRQSADNLVQGVISQGRLSGFMAVYNCPQTPLLLLQLRQSWARSGPCGRSSLCFAALTAFMVALPTALFSNSCCRATAWTAEMSAQSDAAPYQQAQQHCRQGGCAVIPHDKACAGAIRLRSVTYTHIVTLVMNTTVVTSWLLCACSWSSRGTAASRVASATSVLR